MERFQFQKNSLSNSVNLILAPNHPQHFAYIAFAGLVPKDGTYISNNPAIFIKTVPQGVATYVPSIVNPSVFGVDVFCPLLQTVSYVVAAFDPVLKGLWTFLLV